MSFLCKSTKKNETSYNFPIFCMIFYGLLVWNILILQHQKKNGLLIDYIVLVSIFYGKEVEPDCEVRLFLSFFL